MKKTSKKPRAKSTAKPKSGKKYTCDNCGIILSVDNECSCSPCDVICCDQNMRMTTC
jgi:hypothetical protein